MHWLIPVVLAVSGHVAVLQDVYPMGQKPSPEAVKQAKEIIRQVENPPINIPLGGYALIPLTVEAEAYVVPGGQDCVDQQFLKKGQEYRGFLVSKDKPGVYVNRIIPPDTQYDRVLVRGIGPGTTSIIWHTVQNGKSVIIDGKQFVVGDPVPPPPGPPTPPGPNPPLPPAPLPDPGFRVLIVVESKNKNDLPSAQLQAIYSKDVASYLDAHTIKVDNQPEWRILDPDTDMSKATQVWKDAMARPRTSLPWILVTNGKDGFEGPLPPNKDALLKLLKEYGGP